jgi:hypothetical protein
MLGLSQIGAQRRGGGQGGGRTAATLRLPAPIKGLNTSAPVQVLDPQEAVILTNGICQAQGVEMRDGTTVWASGLGARVDTIMTYTPGGSGARMFAAAGANIFDVTGGGVVGAAIVNGLGSSYFRHTMMATPAGQFLFIVNGVDPALHYNGSTWATPTITGVSSADLTNVSAHKNRLWFVEKDSLTAWYLPTASISGAAVAFPVGGFCREGGYLVATDTWSRDGGAGADDLFVAITSKGEVLIYAGTDPANSSTWGLQGVFLIPPPVGPRCFVRAGADLGVMTVSGLVSLDVVLPTSGAAQRKTSLTGKIDDEFRRGWLNVGYSDAWQIIEAPAEQIVLVNVPLPTPVQFCLGVETGGWSKWEGILATCWGLYQDELYCGTADGRVLGYGDNSYTDEGAPIEFRVLPAFTTLKNASGKRVSLVRPILQSAAGVSPSVEMRFDYDVSPLTATPAPAIDGAVWDVAPWDTSFWLSPITPNMKWRSVSGYGVSFSAGLAVAADAKVVHQGFDAVLEQGGVL